MIEKIKSPIRYFIYARKSSESEDKQVASVPSQIKELEVLAKQKNLDVVSILTEEMSAKAPGRPVFNQMMLDIQRGKAQGIICWKLDRLARNPVDGGQIGWLLQQSIIKHIQTYQREYFPADNVLMMNLEFGMANQFVLDLSVNTKRGMKNKASEGWYPHKPPLGYLNNKHKLPELPPIYNDTDSFLLMKQLWKTLLEKQCSISSLYQKSIDIGLVTDRGQPIARSKFYALFQNPFYYGYFSWKGELYPGNHEPMISKAEFDFVQEIISGNKPSFYGNHVFPFTGMIKCGECGASITAENKTKHQKNGNIHHYTYYHCAKSINPECSQKTIGDTDLEKQIIEMLDNIEIPPEFHEWAIKYLQEEQGKETVDREDILKLQQKKLNACVKKKDSLFEMRINNEIDAGEYRQRKELLIEEEQKLGQLIADTHNRARTWLDNAEQLFSFAETAKTRFETGSLIEKREILACLGSNLTLMDRELSIQLKSPLKIIATLASEVQALHSRLEPLQGKTEQRDMEVLYAKNEEWGE